MLPALPALAGVLLAALLALTGCHFGASSGGPVVLHASCDAAWHHLFDESKQPYTDFVVKVPASGLGCPLGINGGHNVTVQSDYGNGTDPQHPGVISLPANSDYSDVSTHYGFYGQNQTGLLDVTNLQIVGLGVLVPVVLNQPHAVTTLDTLHVELRSHRCAPDGQSDQCLEKAHGDCVQSWAGPQMLKVEYFTCVTDYFGMQLQPEQYGAPSPARFSFDHVNIRPYPGQPNLIRYSFWQVTPDPAMSWQETFRNVWTTDAKGGGPRCATVTSNHQAQWSDCGYQPGWPGFSTGAPPGGDFVPLGAVAQRTLTNRRFAARSPHRASVRIRAGRRFR